MFMINVVIFLCHKIILFTDSDQLVKTSGIDVGTRTQSCRWITTWF